jgi:hypothetical protein
MKSDELTDNHVGYKLPPIVAREASAPQVHVKEARNQL